MKKDSFSISILGAGWLGLPLGKALVEAGYPVKGSTTRPEKIQVLQDHGLVPYLFSLKPLTIEGEPKDFFQADLLILNLPPGRRDPEVARSYPAKMRVLFSKIQHPRSLKCIFVSSTSVYGNYEGRVSEDTEVQPSSESGKALVEAEKFIQHHIPQTTLLRMGGLVGGNRHPGRFLAGRTGLSGASQAINLIHLEDCIGIIRAIIHRDIWGECFNCVADGHPNKQTYYTHAAQSMGLEAPKFLPENHQRGKIVSNQKLKDLLHYRFHYADPFDMLTNKNA